MKSLSKRERSIVAGLFLSKFDTGGLTALGFESFTEAFNVFGLALGVPPASIKNYRDEFDPLFPNPRKGWRKRTTRSHCRSVYETYHTLDLTEFAKFLKTIIYSDGEFDVLMEQTTDAEALEETPFARRLITGQAAEQYFRNRYVEVEAFSACKIVDTTRFGCGFDFKLAEEGHDSFMGVEIKGLNGPTGRIVLTHKEFTVAQLMRSRYYLFVVKNFREKPSHQVYCDPIKSLCFAKSESTIVQTMWSAAI